MNTAWRGLLLALGLLLAGHGSRAEDANGDPGPSPTDTHREILSEFGTAYRPQGAGPAASQPAQVLPSALADKGVVRMAPIVVESEVDFGALDRAFAQQHARAREKGVYDKLGIAVHPIRVRKLTAAVVTIFYIPVAVGVSW